MKVLHVYKTYVPDNFTGVPRVIHSLAEAQVDQGIASEVFALTESPAAGSMPVGRHVVRRARSRVSVASTALSVSAFRSFRDAVAEADLVHYHFPWPMGDLLHLAHGRRRPAIATYHSDIVRQRFLKRLYAPVMERFLSDMDRIVATSPDYARTSPVLARHAARLAVIPIGIPDRAPPDEEAVAPWRERVGSGFFLFVGSLRYYKGIGYLVEAARLSGLPVVIAGRDEEGELAGVSLPRNVTFLREVGEDDKDALLALSRAFVLPSHLRSEAFGVALLEAARARRPMISCEIGSGTSYVNRNGETGLVVPPRRPDVFAAAMARLARDDTAAAAMGEAARARYEALFTDTAMARAYRDLYVSVLAGHGKAAGAAG